MKQTYKDLSYLIGKEVEYKGGLHLEQHPEKVKVLEEYEKTILLEMHFPRYELGSRPWKIRRLVSKAAMFCGDIQIRADGRLLTGDAVRCQYERLCS